MNFKDKRIVVLVIITLIAVFYILTLRKGNPWSGDFSEYILQAKSIVNNDISDFIEKSEFRLTHSDVPGRIAMGPLYFPWGFPLILTPVILLYGVDFMAMKILEILFLTLSVLMVFVILKEKLKSVYLFISIILFGLNPDFIFFKDYIVADFPHLFFILLTLYLIEMIYVKNIYLINPIMSYLIIGIFMYLTVLIRPQAIILLPVLFFIQVDFIRKKSRKKPGVHLIPYILFSLLFIGEKSIMYFITSKIFYNPYPDVPLLERIVMNGYYYLALPLELMKFKLNFALKSHLVIAAIVEVFYLIALSVVLLGIIRNFKREKLYVYFILFNILLFFYFPYHQGLRYLYPILPFMIYYFVKGIIILGENRKLNLNEIMIKIVLFIILFLNSSITIALGVNMLIKTNTYMNGPDDQRGRELFQYIQENTKASDVIAFREPRIMNLYANRLSILISDFSSTNLNYADYAVLTETDLNKSVEIKNCKYSEVFRNSKFLVLKSITQ